MYASKPVFSELKGRTIVTHTDGKTQTQMSQCLFPRIVLDPHGYLCRLYQTVKYKIRSGNYYIITAGTLWYYYIYVYILLSYVIYIHIYIYTLFVYCICSILYYILY